MQDECESKLWDLLPNEIIVKILDYVVTGENKQGPPWESVAVTDFDPATGPDQRNSIEIASDMVQVCRFVCKFWNEVLMEFHPLSCKDRRGEISCAHASTNGRLNVLRWLIDNGAKTLTFCYLTAARYGHVNIMVL